MAGLIYVLDATALICYLRREHGADAVQRILEDPTKIFFAHALNLCEVYYDFFRTGGREEAHRAIVDLEKADVQARTDCDAVFWQAAATLKAIRKRVSLADCFAVTLAQRLDATLLTADHHEFDPLANDGICRIEFVR